MPAIRIPRYQQQTTAQGQAAPRVGVAAPQNDIGASMASLGAAGMQLSEQMHRQDEEKRILLEKRQIEDAKLESHRVLSEARLTWTEKFIGAQQTAAPGAAGFTPELLKQFDEYSAKAMQERPDEITQKLLAEGFQNLRTQIGQDALQFEAQARVDNKVNSLEAGINKAAQAVLADPRQRDLAMKEQLAYIGAMDIPPKSKEVLTEKLMQTMDSAALNGNINSSRNSVKAMDALLLRMEKGEFSGVPVQQLAVAEGRINSFKNSLIVRAEAAERRRMAGIEQMSNRLSWYVQNGQDIPPDEAEKFSRMAKGTPYDGAINVILAEQRAVSELGKLPPDQQVARLRAMEASYGAKPNKEQLMHLDKVRRYVDNGLKLLKESPLDYAIAREGAEVAPLDIQKPETWAGTLGPRVAIVKEQAARTGVVPKGLLPQEAAALSSVLQRGTVEQKHAVLKQLYTGFGDDKVYRATMQQIAQDNPVIAAAGIFAGRGRTSSRDRSVADLILRGQEILSQNKKEDGKPSRGTMLQMPEESMLTRLFSDYEGDAFAGKEQARNVFFQTAKSIYAAKSVEDGDFAGTINPRRWDAAMELATGGIERYNGRDIVMHYGMDAGDFKDGVKARVSRAVESGILDSSFTADDLLNLPLENDGDGRYILRSGDSFIVDKNRRKFVIDFNQ